MSLITLPTECWTEVSSKVIFWWAYQIVQETSISLCYAMLCRCCLKILINTCTMPNDAMTNAIIVLLQPLRPHVWKRLFHYCCEQDAIYLRPAATRDATTLYSCRKEYTTIHYRSQGKLLSRSRLTRKRLRRSSFTVVRGSCDRHFYRKRPPE